MTTDVSRHPPPATETNVAAGNAERRKGRKPFGSLMKRLASLKNHTNSASSSSQSRTANGIPAACSGQSPYSTDYPFKGGKSASGPPSTSASAMAPSHVSFGPNHHESTHSLSSTASVSSSGSRDHSLTQTPSEMSRRPAPSAITATTATTSSFSSPTPSVRSLTTTLTTIQSTAPGSMLDPYPHYNPHPSHHHNPNAPPMLFQHQFPSSNGNPPTSPGPAMAMNNGSLHPLNYSTATAGGLLTDNASILTLASSSKRRRRRSFDTDASVRALAPSSLWGGSRESLPLSVLSGNFDTGRSIAGDRGSLYGSTSFTTARGDAASMSYAGSMRDYAGGSGSIMGEISGASPLCASPHTGMSIIGNRESVNLGKSSRRNSAWVKDEEGEEEDEEDDDATNRRRSMSVNGDADDGEGRGGDGASMRDGSSSVGIWHGVYGKREDAGEKCRKYVEGKN